MRGRCERSGYLGDNYHVLAFDSIVEKAAERTADQAVHWLISRGYICEAVSECAYGEDGRGHKAGPEWLEIADEAEMQRLWSIWSKRTGQPAPSASETLGEFLALEINGVQASSRRGVHTAGENCSPTEEGI